MPEGNVAPAPAAPEPPSRRPARIPLWIWIFVLLVAGFLLTGLLQPARCKVRESAKRSSCKNNLRQIGIALHLYADENDAAFPTVDTLQAFGLLYPNYTDNARIYSCASLPAHNGGGDFAPGGTLQANSTSYVYLPGRFVELPGDFVLAHDKPDNHGGAGINVLHVDASVSWVSKSGMPELAKTIADQETRLPELRRKWEQERAAGKSLKSRSDDPGATTP